MLTRIIIINSRGNCCLVGVQLFKKYGMRESRRFLVSVNDYSKVTIGQPTYFTVITNFLPVSNFVLTGLTFLNTFMLPSFPMLLLFPRVLICCWVFCRLDFTLLPHVNISLTISATRLACELRGESILNFNDVDRHFPQNHFIRGPQRVLKNGKSPL